MIIPLVGCKVRIISGKHHDKEGNVTRVQDYRTKLYSMSDEEASLFVRAQKARHGKDWADKWFKATIELTSGTTIEVGPGEILALTPELVRSESYRSV